MIRKIVIVFGLCAVGLFAQADWLYWMIDFKGGKQPWESGDEAPSTAWLVARDTVGNAVVCSSLIGGDVDNPLTGDVDLSELWTTVKIPVTSDFSGLSSAYSFYVELGNTLGDATWVSTGLSYTDAQNGGHIAASAMEAVSLTAWVPTNWTEPGDVPEPTSGLLVLMGMGLLALRRRTDVRA